MNFIWHSSTGTIPAPLRARRDIRVWNSPGEDTTHLASALIVEILTPDDIERGFELIESRCGANLTCIFEQDGSVASAIRWVKAGAAHVASSFDELCQFMDAAVLPSGNAALKDKTLIGDSAAIAKIEGDIGMVANRRCNVLIEGETGTGKEVVARAIHASGNRSRGPWVAVNCSAIPEPLLEAELFGYVRGAFTGAVQTKMGKFEAANHGTIFLDEIGDMPLATQAKLLRVLQEREVEKLGGNESIRLDVRVIAATNAELSARVKEGTFRQDLFYRLNVFRMELPPLRERTGDIASLAKHFVDKVCANERISPKTLDRSTLERLMFHSWPGNIRELENTMETAVVVSGTRAAIFPSDLRLSRTARSTARESLVPAAVVPTEGLDYQKTIEEFEKTILTRALARTRGNKTAAANMLGLKRTTLAAKMRTLESSMPRLVA
jgi:transcriptional regulator with GAF, ATPase, and Fis domain